MDNRQTGAVLIVGGLLFVALLLFIQVRGLESQWQDPCEGQDIRTCEVSK